MMGRIGWIAGLVLLAMPVAACAAPIEYIFNGTVTGHQSNGTYTGFTSVQASIIGIGDTVNEYSTNNGFDISLSSLTLTISGIGTLSESNPSYISVDQSAGTVSFLTQRLAALFPSLQTRRLQHGMGSPILILKM